MVIHISTSRPAQYSCMTNTGIEFVKKRIKLSLDGNPKDKT